MKYYKYVIEDKCFGEISWTHRTNDPVRALRLLRQGVYGESGLMYASYYCGEKTRTLYIDGRQATTDDVHELEMEIWRTKVH